MKLDEFIRREAKQRAAHSRFAPSSDMERELIGALIAFGVEVARDAREQAEAHRQRAAGLGATFALQEFADGICLSLSKVR